MNLLKIYFVKLLKKITLLDKINFTLKTRLNNSSIIIPFMCGIGLTNLILRKNWLDYLIQSFAKNQNKTFIDVGVNIGQTLLKVKTISPEIKYLGFEPNSTCTSYVNLLIEKNKFNNCIIQNVALSSQVENLTLEKSINVDSRASVISLLRPNFFTEEEVIFSVDYSSFFPNEQIGFIKIDVEGAEYEVLKGMEESIRKFNPIIVCEVLDSHNQDVFEFTQKRATLVSNLVKSLNYGILQLIKNQKTSCLDSFKELDKITINQWTAESEAFNDYIFYPIVQQMNVVNVVNEICKK